MYENQPRITNVKERIMWRPNWRGAGSRMTRMNFTMSRVMLSECCTPLMIPISVSLTFSCRIWVMDKSICHRPIMDMHRHKHLVQLCSIWVAPAGTHFQCHSIKCPTKAPAYKNYIRAMWIIRRFKKPLTKILFKEIVHKLYIS